MRLTNWLDKPEEAGCPVTISTLTLQDIECAGTVWSTITHYQNGESLGYLSEMCSFALPLRWTFWNINFGGAGHCLGRTAPGFIVIDDIYREKDSDIPYVNSTFLILYAWDQEGNVDGLRHVFVSGIANSNTLPLLKTFGSDSHNFNCSSSEYYAFLALGSVGLSAILPLEAFPRGTHAISGVTLIRQTRSYNLRFDIVHV